jgi:steroid 5-alpha reductase family enzyme
VGQVPQSPDGLIWLDIIGIVFWGTGIFFESVGDIQLARFKRNPANVGRVMDQGLWRYTRHPNYFGDFMVWWGLFLVALATGEAWWTVIGPIVMSVLLIRVSGAGLLEKSLKTRREGYEDYMTRTGGFFPRPPRKAG